jgi:hypothetical protein
MKIRKASVTEVVVAVLATTRKEGVIAVRMRSLITIAR